MNKKVCSLKWTIYFQKVEHYCLLFLAVSISFSLGEKRLFFRRRKLKIIFCLVILNPLRLLFIFDHQFTIHIPVDWSKQLPPLPSPCDQAVRGFAERIIFNLKLVIILKNTTKAINKISLYSLDWLENKVDCKPKLKFLHIPAENRQRHVLTKFHQVITFLLHTLQSGSRLPTWKGFIPVWCNLK